MSSDGTTHTAGVIVVVEERVLLIEHGEGAGHVTGAWGIPAGAIDENETARAAAVRELAEEAGLRVDPEALIELPMLYEAVLARKTGAARFSLRAFTTDQFEGELTPSPEGVPTWVQIDRVAGLPLLLGNTAEAVVAAVEALRAQPQASP